jgi:hypothetical protein
MLVRAGCEIENSGRQVTGGRGVLSTPLNAAWGAYRWQTNVESYRGAAFSKRAPLLSAAAQLTAPFATFRTLAPLSRW